MEEEASEFSILQLAQNTLKNFFNVGKKETSIIAEDKTFSSAFLT